MSITTPRKTEFRIDLEDKFREVARAGRNLMIENAAKLNEYGLGTDEYEEAAKEFDELGRMRLDDLSVDKIGNMIYNIGFRCGSVKTIRIIAGNNRGDGENSPEKESEQ